MLLALSPAFNENTRIQTQWLQEQRTRKGQQLSETIASMVGSSTKALGYHDFESRVLISKRPQTQATGHRVHAQFLVSSATVAHEGQRPCL